MIRKMQILAYLSAITLALVTHTNVKAIDADVTVEAQFRTALTLSVSQTMDFTPGSRAMEYADAATIDGSLDYVSMATNGDLSNPVGSQLTTAYATGQRGELAFTGDNATVSISCNTDTTLSETGTGLDLPFTNAELDVAADIGSVGATLGNADYDCLGLGTTPFTYTITGGGGVIAVGGRIEGLVNMVSAVYSTANTGQGGVPMTVRVVYGP